MLLSAVTREELLQHLHRAPTSFATDEATGQLTTALHNPNEVVRAELRREASRLSGEMTASGEMTRPSPETSFTSVDPS